MVMDSPVLIPFLLSTGLVLLLQRIFYSFQFRKIPTAGPSSLTSFLNGFRFVKNAQSIVADGYSKYRDGAFKVATLNSWMVVISGRKLNDELNKAPDDMLNVTASFVEAFQFKYTIEPSIYEDKYHEPLIRSQLTRNVGKLLPEMYDEMVSAFNDTISVPSAGEWSPVCASDALRLIITRMSNRAFVGPPLCRDPDYTALSMDFTVDIFKSATFITMFPSFLRPLIGPFFNNEKSVQRAMRHLKPLVEHRQREMRAHARGKDWDEKPNDFLQYLLDDSDVDKRSLRSLALRLLVVNFAAIHTTSMTVTHALYDLAYRPEYQEPLRVEAQAAIDSDGWTKAALNKMSKLDSFLRESQRCNGLSCVSPGRMVMQPSGFTFSDGTHVPQGALVCPASLATHMDDVHYTGAASFDGFRFAGDGEHSSSKQHLVTVDSAYLAFGQGRHACPGRFFAAGTLKSMLAHVVLNYDVKLEDEGVRPATVWIEQNSMPHPTAKVLFRARKA